MLSSLSVPLPFQGATIGALNTYASQPQAFSHHDVDLAEEVAAWLVVAVGNAEAAARTSDDLTQLRIVMMSRSFIEQAKGILMEREGITADVAYQRMRSAARSSRRPVAEVAQIVVGGGPWGLPRKDS